MMKIVLVILLLGISLPVLSFNFRNCKRSLQPYGMFGGITSSVQFSTSTGACAAVAYRAEEKERFFAINYDKLQNEAARGYGEHLYTLGQLSNCSKDEQFKLNEYFKKNYPLIFLSDYREEIFGDVNDITLTFCQRS